MAKRPRSGLTVTPRSPRAWAAFLIVLSGLVFMVLDRIDHPWARTARSGVTDALAPALTLMDQPLRWGDSALDWLTGWWRTHARNRSLEAEVASLPALRSELIRLQTENRRLRGLLNMVPAQQEVIASVRVIGVTGGAFVRNVIVSGGRRRGLEYGQPVTDAHGLVGRVLELGDSTARVLLISDWNSRVPVFVGDQRLPAIAEGRNSGHLRLRHLPENALPRTGDRVVTSGHGGVFPPGLAVGRVVQVTRTDGAMVLPAAALDRLDVVQVRRALSEPPAPSLDQAEARQDAP